MRKYGLYYGAPFLPYCLYGLILFISGRHFLAEKFPLTKFKSALPVIVLIWGLYFGGGNIRFVPFLSDYGQIRTELKKLSVDQKVCAQSSHFPLLSYNLNARLMTDNCLQDPTFSHYVLSNTTNPYPHRMEKINQYIAQLKSDPKFELLLKTPNMLLFKRK